MSLFLFVMIMHLLPFPTHKLEFLNQTCALKNDLGGPYLRLSLEGVVGNACDRVRNWCKR